MRFGFLAFCLGLVLAFSPLQAQSLRILALGDSLTAGLGVEPADAFPAKLEAALKARGHDIVITNAGVSGDTSAAGAERLDWALGDPVDAVIVELGANDALRGIDPEQTEKALDRILTEIKKRNLPVLFAGMLAPRNLGPDYGKKYDALFPRLAQKHGVLFYPFFLDGVAADPALNQPDGLHPNSKGVDMIVSRILPITEDLLKQAASK
jgi:acyl-CoA thioesterase-1